MTALVSVTRVEGGVTRRLEGAAAYQFLFELDAAKVAPAHPTADRRAVRRPAGGPPSDNEAKVLRTLAAIDAAAGLDRYQLAEHVHISPDSVTWHVRRLTDRGHVQVEVRAHGRKLYTITDAGRATLTHPAPSGQPCKHGGRMEEVFNWFRDNAGEAGASVNECAAGLGHHPQGLRGAIERLEGAHRLELIASRPYRYRLPQGAPK